MTKSQGNGQAHYTEFINNLYRENLRGAWEFESLRYGIMARLGLNEPDALELAVKIVISQKQVDKRQLSLNSKP